jgi:predicted DNA binding CopG/RHH family protein
MKKIHLDKEERDILRSVESGEWKSIPSSKREIKRHILIARRTIRKDKRINIRLSHHDLQGLRLKAVREGIPYQTLIASILHKFVSGRFVEKR